MTETKDPRLLLAETLHRLTAEVKRNWTSLRTPVPYDEFDAGVRPVLEAARQVIDAAGRQARDVAQIDAFVLGVLESARTGIRFDTKDRPRALLYSLLLGKELEALAAGRPAVGSARDAMAEDRRALHAELGEGWEALDDPTACWFIPGAVADPDASMVIDVFKITSLTYSEYESIHVQVLIPRSKAAKWVHMGRRADDFDPAWHRLMEDDATRQPVHHAEIAALEVAAAEAEAAERSATEAQLEAFDAALPVRRAELSAALRDTDQEGEVIAKTERKKAEADLVELSHRFKPAVSRARDRADRIARRSPLEFETPVAAATGALALFLQPWLGLLPAAVGLALGFGLAWAARRRIAAAPAAVEARFRAELKRVRSGAEVRAGQRATRLRAEAEGALQALHTERERIVAASGRRIAAILEERDRRIAELVADDEHQLTARPIAEVEQHPALVLATQNGFMRGKAPNKEHIKVLHDQKYAKYVNSLSPDGRERLVRERDRLPRKEFDQLIERLIS